MALVYTFSEQVDMLLVLGFCRSNYRQAAREYQQRFPNRRTPSHCTFRDVEARARETGMFSSRTNDRGRHRTQIREAAEEHILDAVDEDPTISVRQVSRDLRISKSISHSIIKENLFHPYHIECVQELIPPDLQKRLRFCRILENKSNRFPNFYKNILFTDESTFTRRGVNNLHNEHVYALENPHAVKSIHFQREFSINVWMGIIDRYLIGPVMLPNRLNGESFLQFLEQNLNENLEDVPLAIRRNMWFMLDGAPPHFSVNVRHFLDSRFPNKWIGRGNEAPIQWPPRSPDLNPCDFYLWGTLKTKVYNTPVNTIEELWQRIEMATSELKSDPEQLRRVNFNFARRIRLCSQQNGGIFENLL